MATRLVTYGAACSLDGFITGPNGELDWLLMTADARKVMGEYWPRIDTVLMGRKTWEHAAASGMGGGYPGVGTYVFSRTLTTDPAPGVNVIVSFNLTIKAGTKPIVAQGMCMQGSTPSWPGSRRRPR